MKAVLYAQDLEPITVLDIDPQGWKRLARGGTWNIAVFRPIRFWKPSEDIINEPVPIVRITADRIAKGEYETLLLFTHDEETALLMKAAFLPGQVNSMREFNCDAFREGFLHALRNLS